MARRSETPARSASVCSGSDDFRAVFCNLILLVSSQSSFNHGSKSDVWPAFQEASDTLPLDGAWPSQLAVVSIWRRSGGLPARPCWRWVVPLLRGLGARVAGAPGAPGRSPVGAASGRQLCSGLLSRGEFGREGSKRRRAQRAHTPHSRSVAANWLRVGVGGEILRPEPIADWPRLWETGCEGSVASGIRAANSSGCARTKQEPPGGPARPGKPSWPAPLCLPSPVSLPDSRNPAGAGVQAQATVPGDASCAPLGPTS